MMQVETKVMEDAITEAAQIRSQSTTNHVNLVNSSFTIWTWNC